MFFKYILTSREKLDETLQDYPEVKTLAEHHEEERTSKLIIHQAVNKQIFQSSH